MDHSEMKDMILALYDGELDTVSRKEAEIHLASCRECRESYDRWAKTAKTFFQAPSVQPSEFFVHQVMDRVHALEQPRRVWEWSLSLRWLIPAATAALLFLALLPMPTQNVPMDAFLLQDAAGQSSWVFSKNALSNDETLQLVMEGQS